MASDSEGARAGREAGHRNHFRLLGEEGRSWSGREPNVLFLNRGDGTFDEVASVAGLGLRLDGRGAAVADLDGDGDLDLVVYSRNTPTIKIYRNDTPGQGNVCLVDLDPRAVGAQVVLRCGGHRILRQVEAGSGFVSQSASTLHFGLGGCRSVDALEIRWPSGRVQTLHGLPANRRLRVREGSDEIVISTLRPRNFNRGDSASARTGALSAPRPDLAFARLDGKGELALESFDASTVLLSFWATTCAACVAEVEDLMALKASYAARGVRFVGICMDDRERVERVLDFVEARGFAFEHVWGEIAGQRPFASLAGAPVGAIPVTAVLHRGVVRYVRAGLLEKEELAAVLEGLLE